MIFIALQNPGTQYEKTRHNAGAIALREVEDLLISSSVVHAADKDFSNCAFYYSDVFMNLSGEFVKKVLKKENIANKPEDLKNVFVFFDDMNIPVGKFIISQGVGAASHNGIKSILAHGIQNEFYRVRIGVGGVSDNKKEKVKKVHGGEMSDFVLSKLSDLEIAIIKSQAKKIAENILHF